MTGRAAGEWARHWRHPGLPGVDLLSARYVRHRFGRHTHDEYTIGLVSAGVEEWRHRGTTERAGAGMMPIVNPDTPHTGHAGAPGGWTYRVLYPSVTVVSDVAAELGLSGLPYFPVAALDDPETASAFLAAHRAAEAGDALAATSLTSTFLAGLLRRHARLGAVPTVPSSAGATTARRAREMLVARLTDPPTLAELAASLDTGQFALLRAFRSTYGLPPHAYLTQYRVEQARRLLTPETRVPGPGVARPGGTPGAGPTVSLAEAALAVGFTDQAHLTRHFRRVVGVPPGAYRAERAR